MKGLQHTLNLEKVPLKNDSIAGPLTDSTHYQSKSLFREVKFYRATFIATLIMVIAMGIFYFSLL